MLIQSLKELLEVSRSDAVCYGRRWYSASGFWVTLSYRLRKLRKEAGGPYLLLIIPDLLLTLIRSLISDSSLPTGATIGRSFCLPHPNGVLINDQVVIGDNVKIFQQVTVGEWGLCAPVLEDNVELFAGAKVFGECRVGKGVKVGTNAVVNFDVPAGSTVFPAASVVKLSRSESVNSR
ncbi:serine acetyltransferase [Marinobacterium jannaschii]|uniref:serine acetyltransferase n=1 Tax=Marinobacterium jannaschii TaxID=64970 RepID=UPI000686EA25|nr:serine acetyltransferase [Marinobacterium jannaschii]